MAESTQRPQEYKRFSRSQRFEHLLLLVTFTGLGITGLVQRYASTDIGAMLIALMGGIEGVRIIHRILATILMAESIYHGGIISYKLFVLGQRATMLPSLKDAKDVIQWIGYNLGFTREHPQMPRFNFGEKAEYLALVWGTIVMIVTGFMMWNPIATTKVLPGAAIPAARFAHSAEALLAVLSIIIWHMYNVHVRRFNRSMFTGKMPRDAMLEEHAAELHEIDSGHVHPTPPQEVIEKRTRWFLPYATVMTLVLVTGLIYFVTFETSALVTLPERQTEINYDIDPTGGDFEQGLVLWSEANCVKCHGIDTAGQTELNISLAERDVTFDRFITAIRVGPADMPAYPTSQVSDEQLQHLWAWFESVNN